MMEMVTGMIERFLSLLKNEGLTLLVSVNVEDLGFGLGFGLDLEYFPLVYSLIGWYSLGSCSMWLGVSRCSLVGNSMFCLAFFCFVFSSR
jgi:hypothetical protein